MVKFLIKVCSRGIISTQLSLVLNAKQGRSCIPCRKTTAIIAGQIILVVYVYS